MTTDGVQSVPSPSPAPVELADRHAHFEDALASWHALVDRDVSSTPELVASLEALYRAIYDTDFAALRVDEVGHVAQAAIDDLFDLSLRLRDRVPEWRRRGVLVGKAPAALRNAVRVLRYTCDILGEVSGGFKRLDADKTSYAAFDGPPQWTSMHPALELGTRPRFRSGDVLLVRGRLHNSAAIARIGDVDSQFSHIGVIYVDADREPWVVEALIEDGASINPLAHVLQHNLGRAVLFRHRDRILAECAAALIHERVRRSLGLFGRWIPYDFSMELSGAERLFCSKLVRLAYFEASDGRVILPTFATHINMTNRDFVSRIGVTAATTFAPADIEIEPGFDIVAEWRDYRVTPVLRMQDLIMTKLFEWMDRFGYRFQEDLGIRVVELLGGLARHFPGSVKSAMSGVVPKVPSNMTRSTIGVIAMLHKTAQPLLEAMLELDRRQIASTGRPLHPRQVFAELERMRETSPGRIGYLVAPR